MYSTSVDHAGSRAMNRGLGIATQYCFLSSKIWLCLWS